MKPRSNFDHIHALIKDGYIENARAVVEAEEHLLYEARVKLAVHEEFAAESDEVEAAAFLRGRKAGENYAKMWQEQHEIDVADRRMAIDALKIGLECAEKLDAYGVPVFKDVLVIATTLKKLEQKEATRERFGKFGDTD